MRTPAILLGVILIAIFTGAALAATASDLPEAEENTIGRTPPRLSYTDGQVSFWRPGAEQWVEARINTALAPGDQLFISGVGGFELQIGAKAFVRGGADALIELETREPDFLRFKVSSGQAGFDLRALAPGRTLEVNTPHGAFTIDHEGYYRLDVSDESTSFITRRNGRAVAIPAGGDAVPVESNEALVFQDPSGQGMAFQAAPAIDDWDNWNYARTDQLLEARSMRYVAPETYGTADLDRYGSWRKSLTYGSVWVPAGVPPGWAPYTTGNWMYDPYYGWTWVDTAPWGWAPYHYGRWVHVNSYWCWAPGPAVRRAVYAPALVAFFGRPGLSVGVSIGRGPAVGWVALSWGEPLVPWWGRPAFIHRPWWGGWGGPRIVNGRVIHHRTVVSVRDIHRYRNSRVRNAMVAVDKGRFGHGPIDHKHLRRVNARDWRPMHRANDFRPTAASYVPTTRRGVRPPEKIQRRSVVRSNPSPILRPGSARDSGSDLRRKKQPPRPGHGNPPQAGPGVDRSQRVSGPSGVRRPALPTGGAARDGQRRKEQRPNAIDSEGRSEQIRSRRDLESGKQRAPSLKRRPPSAGSSNAIRKEPRSRKTYTTGQSHRPAQKNGPRIAPARPSQPPANRKSNGRRILTVPKNPRPTGQLPERPNTRLDVPGSSRRPESTRTPAGRMAAPRQESRRPSVNQGARTSSGQGNGGLSERLEQRRRQ